MAKQINKQKTIKKDIVVVPNVAPPNNNNTI
jgi:hypothetical protein